LSLENFYSILEYGEDDMDNWLVDYSVQNEEIDHALRNLSIDLRELEKEHFNIKFQNEINAAPLRSYIEEWIQRAMEQVVDERQQTVGTIPVVVDDNNKKESTRK
jgi:predicted metalloenzyme YecM